MDIAQRVTTLRYCAAVNARFVSVLGFSFLFVYLLAFLFEGQIFYGLLTTHQIKAPGYIFTTMAAHFVGLFFCGSFVQSARAARRVVCIGISICLLATLPLFFTAPDFWLPCLLVSGCVSGCVVAAWGHFLKAFTLRDARITSCADVLIVSNILMICINVIAVKISPFVGLACVMICAVVGMCLIGMLPEQEYAAQPLHTPDVPAIPIGSDKPLWLLFVFVSIISVNSGLMYQVIVPAFKHLTEWVLWYWALPYIVALFILRSLPVRAKRALFLYVAIAMMMLAFISFMLLGRGVGAYLVVDTLLLGSCGIFDLFWWSILGFMLDYTDNPVRMFGIGLSANVFGVLCGGVLGTVIMAIGLTGAELTVIALVVACVTMALLPFLSRQLLILFKSHVYLAEYDHMTEQQQHVVLHTIAPREPLTYREKAVLQAMLLGKSNKSLAEMFCITESTVKTHVRNIFVKYNVASRAALLSTLLQQHTKS